MELCVCVCVWVYLIIIKSPAASSIQQVFKNGWQAMRALKMRSENTAEFRGAVLIYSLTRVSDAQENMSATFTH